MVTYGPQGSPAPIRFRVGGGRHTAHIDSSDGVRSRIPKHETTLYLVTWAALLLIMALQAKFGVLLHQGVPLLAEV